MEKGQAGRISANGKRTRRQEGKGVVGMREGKRVSRAKKVYLTGAAVIVIGWFAPNGVGGVGLLLFAIGLVMSFFEGRRDAA